MSWLILALIAPALYAASNFIDKYVVEHKIRDVRGIPIYSTIAAIVFSTTIWGASGFPTLSLQNAVLVMASGTATIFGFLLYLKALSQTQTSLIIALFQTVPLFTLILAVTLLNEHLAMPQVAGFFLVLCAAFGLSLEKSGEKFRVNAALWLMLCSSLLWAIAYTLIKFTSGLEGFVPILAYESWGIAVGGLLMFVFSRHVRQAFFTSFRSVGKVVMTTIFINEALFITAKAISFLAISLGPVSLVTVLGGTQVFYGILLGTVLTLLLPKLFHEDVSKKEMVKRVLLSAVLVGGVALIGEV